MTRTDGATIDWTQLTRALSQPFEESEIKYRAGAISRDKTMAQALPYADPRVYEDRLNSLVPGEWEVEFEPWGDSRIICRLSIHGVTRSSTGESGDGPEAVAGTSAEAQAFKRACAKFGLGRYLYSLDAEWVPYDADRRQLKVEPRHLSTARAGASSGRANAPRRPASSTEAARGEDRKSPPTSQSGTRSAKIEALSDQLGLKPASAIGPAEAIGSKRAADMRKALVACDIARSDHGVFASAVVGRKVVDLSSLTDKEARRVWIEAKARQAEVTPAPQAA